MILLDITGWACFIRARRRIALWRGALAVSMMMLAIACGGAATATVPSPEAVNAASSPVAESGTTPAAASANAAPGRGMTTVDASKAPALDTSVASVPLNKIVFDTFGRGPGQLPLDRATEEEILGLRDAIAPVYQPVYGPQDALPWLSDGSLVLGYLSGDEAYAYPINVLNFHELVNDVIGGAPVLISYCPLCLSGVVYSRSLDGQTLLFGNTSALYQSDLVMYDHQTGSYWFQVGGEAVVGPLTHSRLKLLPSTSMTWAEWKRLHPGTRLLTGAGQDADRFASSRYSRGFGARYQDRVNEGEFVFPVDDEKLDRRLPYGAVVLTVEVGGAATAYPFERIGDSAVNDEVGGQPVVVFARSDSRLLAAFSPVVGGKTLTFRIRPEDGDFVDRETGSIWDAAGRATGGPLSGARLGLLDTRRAFWFSVAIALPQVEVYFPDAG